MWICLADYSCYVFQESSEMNKSNSKNKYKGEYNTYSVPYKIIIFIIFMIKCYRRME